MKSAVRIVPEEKRADNTEEKDNLKQFKIHQLWRIKILLSGFLGMVLGY